MKYNYYLWCVCLLLGACHQDTFDKKLTHSIQRLSEINQNKTSDTIILKAALDSAYLLALNVSTDRKSVV